MLFRSVSASRLDLLAWVNAQVKSAVRQREFNCKDSNADTFYIYPRLVHHSEPRVLLEWAMGSAQVPLQPL